MYDTVDGKKSCTTWDVKFIGNSRDKLPVDWCRISFINSSSVGCFVFFLFFFLKMIGLLLWFKESILLTPFFSNGCESVQDVQKSIEIRDSLTIM